MGADLECEHARMQIGADFRKRVQFDCTGMQRSGKK